MHAAAVEYEAHGQLVGSNRRFLLARLEGGFKRSEGQQALAMEG